MRIKILKSIFVTVALLVPQVIRAQGTTYISNLDQTPTGSQAVGSDSWLGIAFRTGNNPGGYTLDSVQLGMSAAAGSPSGFLAMIYDLDPNKLGGAYPGISLGNLNGSSSPASGYVSTYTADANFTLLPDTRYFIVLTAGTPVATGSYELNMVGTHSYTASDGWGQSSGYCYSSTGSSWGGDLGYLQYAINATAVPEPSTLVLFALGGLPWAWRRFCRGR